MNIRGCVAALLVSAMLPMQCVNAADAPRFTQKSMEQLSPEQKEAAEGVLKQSSSGLGGPYAMLLTNPELLKRYLMMTEYHNPKVSCEISFCCLVNLQ